MTLLELHYTSAEQGLGGSPGFQFVQLSAGLDPGVCRQVESLLAYEPPRTAPSQPTQAQIADFPVALNGLAWLLVTAREPGQRNPERAVELAGRATRLAPKDGGFWNTLGVARYRASDFSGAIEALHKSMEFRGGGDSVDYFFLAMSHKQLGQDADAQKWQDKALVWMKKNDPENPDLILFQAEAAAVLAMQAPPIRPKGSR